MGRFRLHQLPAAALLSPTIMYNDYTLKKKKAGLFDNEKLSYIKSNAGFREWFSSGSNHLLPYDPFYELSVLLLGTLPFSGSHSAAQFSCMLLRLTHGHSLTNNYSLDHKQKSFSGRLNNEAWTRKQTVSQ